MPWHVLIYQGSGVSTATTDMTPVPDPIVAIQNGHYLPHQDLFLYGAWAGGTTLDSATIVTPRSRQVVPPRMYPIDATLEPPDRPHIIDRRMNPFKLNAVEEISIQTTYSSTTSTASYFVMLVGTGQQGVPAGDIYSLHGTATTAAVANAWTQLAITWDQTIPAGTYAVVGSNHVSASAVAHRFIFKDAILRPGFLSLQSIADMTAPDYYTGGWGLLGQFNTYTYPAIEVLCETTDASHDFVMNFIKVA